MEIQLQIARRNTLFDRFYLLFACSTRVTEISSGARSKDNFTRSVSSGNDITSAVLYFTVPRAHRFASRGFENRRTNGPRAPIHFSKLATTRDNSPFSRQDLRLYVKIIRLININAALISQVQRTARLCLRFSLRHVFRYVLSRKIYQRRCAHNRLARTFELASNSKSKMKGKYYSMKARTHICVRAVYQSAPIVLCFRHYATFTTIFADLT